MLTNEEVAKVIITQFGENVSDFDDPYDLLTFTTGREQLIPIFTYLKGHSTFQFGFLTDITAVHYPDSVGREFCVVYHVHSLINNFRLRIKVYLTADDVHIPTLTPCLPVRTGWSVKPSTCLGLSSTGIPTCAEF